MFQYINQINFNPSGLLNHDSGSLTGTAADLVVYTLTGRMTTFSGHFSKDIIGNCRGPFLFYFVFLLTCFFAVNSPS